MPRIEPTIGRIVWFFKNPETTEHENVVTVYDAPCAAIIAAVLPAQDADPFDRLNLDVVDHEGRHHPMHNVILVQDEGVALPEGTTCAARWMPYQLGQAAKTEEAEKRNERFRNEVRGEQELRSESKANGDPNAPAGAAG